MEEEILSKVYIKLDEQNRVVAIDGGYTIQNVDVKTWLFIDEGTGDRYNLCQSNYLPKPLYTDDGFCAWKYDEKAGLEERTEKEIDEDRSSVPVVPTEMDKVEAQLDWTAIMTDTLINSSQAKANSDTMFEKIKAWYDMGLWTAEQVAVARDKGIITKEQYDEIVGNDKKEEK